MKAKLFTLAILALSALTVQSQSQAVSSNSLDATTKEMYQERISDISKEVEKIDRQIVREERIIRTRENVVRESARQIEYIGKQEQENVNATAQLKGEIAGHDLDALESRIKYLTRDQKSLERNNKRDANSIIRKKAQIEKLLGEITMLEERILTHEQTIIEKEEQIQETEVEITEFALVTKNDQLKELEKDRSQLQAQKNRENRRKGKAEDEIHDSETTIRALEVQRKTLIDEKRSKENALRPAQSFQ